MPVPTALAGVVGSARGHGWPGAPSPDLSPPGMAGEVKPARAVGTGIRAPTKSRSQLSPIPEVVQRLGIG